MIEPYLQILAMTYIFIFNSNHLYYRDIECFIMAMLLNMILNLYVINYIMYFFI